MRYSLQSVEKDTALVSFTSWRDKVLPRGIPRQRVLCRYHGMPTLVLQSEVVDSLAAAAFAFAGLACRPSC